jgi:hypothetical protein
VPRPIADESGLGRDSRWPAVVAVIAGLLVSLLGFLFFTLRQERGKRDALLLKQQQVEVEREREQERERERKREKEQELATAAEMTESAETDSTEVTSLPPPLVAVGGEVRLGGFPIQLNKLTVYETTLGHGSHGTVVYKGRS